MSNVLLVFCNCPDHFKALALAKSLVEMDVAACVSVLPKATSIYKWQGQIEHAEESLLMIKTSNSRYAELEAAIKLHHPHEIPEIIAVPIEQGFTSYLAWVEQCTNT